MIRNKQTVAAVGALLAGIALVSASRPTAAAGMQAGGGPNDLLPRTDLPIIQIYQDPDVPKQERPKAGSDRGLQQAPPAPLRQGGSGRRSGSMGMGSSRSRPPRGSDYGSMGVGPGVSPSVAAPDSPYPGDASGFGGGAGQWPSVTGQSRDAWGGYPPRGVFNQGQGAGWRPGVVGGPGVEAPGFGSEGPGYGPPSWVTQPPGDGWRPQSLPGYKGAASGGENFPLESQPEAMGFPPAGAPVQSPATGYPLSGGVGSGAEPGIGQTAVTGYAPPGWSGYPGSEGFGGFSPPALEPAWEQRAGQSPGGLQAPEMGYPPGNWMGYPPGAGAPAGTERGDLPMQMPSYPPAELMGQRPWRVRPPPMPFGPPQMALERAAELEARLQRIEASLQEILENQRRILSKQ